MDKFGIYCIVSPNGSVYVGMTMKSFEERWNGHKKDFRLGRGRCRGLHRAFDKYGTEAMEYIVLETFHPSVSVEQVLRAEVVWWDVFKSAGVNLYNARPTGTGSVIHSEETRERIRDSMREKYPLEDRIRECPVCFESFSVLPSRKTKTCSKTCAGKLRKATNDRIIEDLPESVISMYLEGKMSSRAIAEIFSVHRNHVQEKVRRAGYQLRSTTDHLKSKNLMGLSE